MPDGHTTSPSTAHVAVVVPCLDEAPTIAAVVAGFGRHLPGAQVVVIDNGSTDGTRAAAERAGAIVRTVDARGKGSAVRAALADNEADVVVLIDGDGTYDPADAADVVGPVLRGEADMVIGERMTRLSGNALAPGRRIGNLLITRAVGALTRTRLRDVLSGYRAISGALADKMELRTTGFEIEAELLMESLRAGARIVEVPVTYRARRAGARSKLRPFTDGLLILRTAVRGRRRAERAAR